MVTGGASVSAVVAAGPMAAGPMAAGPMTAGPMTAGPTAAPTVPTGTDTALPTQRRPGENRRSNKPFMEKRRRARINSSLDELKALLLDSMKKDPARHTKLEKADILEMTVKHLQILQRQHAAMSAASDPTGVNQFHAGFNDCLAEVKRYRELDATSRRRLVQHLTTYFDGAAAEGPASNDSSAPASSPTPSPQQAQAAVQVHILQSGTGTHALPALAAAPNGGIILTTNGPGPGLQLVPTRLPSGDIAFILPSAPAAFRQAPPTVSSSPSTSPVPSSSSSAPSPLPMLVPVPTRTASTASASSTSSALSSSPMTFDRLSVASPPDAVATPGPALRDAATSPASAVTATTYRAPPSPSYKRAHSRSPSPYHVPVRPYSPPMQGPLSLVIRKTEAPEGKPWRPW